MATIISEKRITNRKLSESLDKIKCNINDSYTNCEENYDRFNQFQTAITKSSFTELQKTALLNLGKPVLECNIMDSFVNRLLGEFIRQQPSFSVSSKDSNKKANPQLEKFIEGHLRALMTDADQNNFQMDVMGNQLRGGWGVMKVYTDYVNDKSFDQDFILESLDPLQCFFDQTAKLIHKGDAQFCGEFFLMTIEEFESKYGTKYTAKMSFDASNTWGIRWAYSGDFGSKYVLLAQYYEKKRKKKRILQLVTGDVVTEDEYNVLQDSWQKMGKIEQPPGVVGKPSERDIVYVCRSTIIENDVLEYVDTEDKYLPLVWADGNSSRLRAGKGQAPKQFTKPYPYHVMGMQQAKNFALCTWVNDIENMTQSKLIAPKEAIPADYKEAYTNPQKASIYIYNQFKDNNPDVRIDPPRQFDRVAMPPEVIQMFSMADQSAQIILGSYDASLGINNNQLSGSAMQQGAMQSNAAAMPYTNGHIQALNQLAKVMVDKMPRLHKGPFPRSLPVKHLNGKMEMQEVNGQGPNALSMDFDPEDFNIRIEAGVNFETQKSQALETVVSLMKASPQLAQFFGGTLPGIETLLDNVDIRGIDGLKAAVAQFMQQNQQQQQQAQQMQMQQAQMPLMIKQQELKQQADKAEKDFEIKSRELEIKEQDSDTKRMVGLSEVGEKADKVELQRDELDAKRAATDVASINAVANIADVSHKHAMDMLNLHHTNERFHKDLAHKAFMENLKHAQAKEVSAIAEPAEEK